MTFGFFCAALAKIESTSSRLEMTAYLAELFTQLARDEVRPACYLLLGRLVPKFVNVEFNFAEKMVLRVLAEKYGDGVEVRFKTMGDMGNVVAELLPASQQDARSLAEVYAQLEELAVEVGLGSQERKLEKMRRMMALASPQTGKYLVRIVLGTLRLGFSDMTMLDALSWAKHGDKRDRKSLELAFQLRADIGSLAELYLAEGVVGLEKVRVELGVPIAPALCQRLTNAEEMIEKMGQVIVEPKYDGTRVLIHARKHAAGAGLGEDWLVRTFTRNLEESSGMFPELLLALEHLDAEEVVLDSEAVGYDPQTGALRTFQQTIQRKRKHGVEELAQTLPLRFFVFDILYKNGKRLLEKPLYERKELLRQTVQEKGVFLLSPYIVTQDPQELRTYHTEQLAAGLEGVVIKQYASVYQPGRRGWSWVKFKEEEGVSGQLSDTLDCVVMGTYVGQGKRAGFGVGAFLVGVRDTERGTYRTIAKIGTGLSDVQWQELFTRSQALQTSAKPDIYDVPESLAPDVWMRPELVAEIAADQLTISPLHTAGKALRFPRLVRFRDDKNAEQATEMAELTQIG